MKQDYFQNFSERLDALNMILFVFMIMDSNPNIIKFNLYLFTIIINTTYNLFYSFNNTPNLKKAFDISLIAISIACLFILYTNPDMIFNLISNVPISIDRYVLFKPLNGYMNDFFTYFGIISFSIIILQMIKNKYERSSFQQEQESHWDYFVIESNSQKIRKLVIYIFIGSGYEEVIYRFLLFNFLYILYPFSDLAILILSSAFFAILHYRIGGIWHLFSSMVAGISFSMLFLKYGILGAWILHCIWNLLMVLSMVYDKKYLANLNKDI